MARKRHKFPALDHVKYVRNRQGKWYAYFNTGKKSETGNTIYARLPHPSDIGFYDSYAAFKGARTKREVKGQYTVAHLIVDYEQSGEFKRLAGNTRASYASTLGKIKEALGAIPADRLPDDVIQLALDHEGWGLPTQNLVVAIIRAMYYWGRKRAKVTIHPMLDFRATRGGEHEPWPEDVLQAGLTSDDPLIRLCVNLLYYTGQRIGDVLKIRWGDIGADGYISVKQQKTGKAVSFPLHADLSAELGKVATRGIWVICQPGGRPYTVHRIRDILQTFTAALGVKTVPHGLRKNAVNALLECGCTVAEVKAITGQSMQIIEHYAARVNSRKMGKAAILKWERRA